MHSDPLVGGCQIEEEKEENIHSVTQETYFPCFIFFIYSDVYFVDCVDAKKSKDEMQCIRKEIQAASILINTPSTLYVGEPLTLVCPLVHILVQWASNLFRLLLPYSNGSPSFH